MGWEREGGETVKLLITSLQPVFMSCMEIKEVFSELCFHMSARSQTGAGRPHSTHWSSQWSAGRKEMEALLLIGAWFELIIVTISSVRTRNSLNRKKKQDDEDLNLIQDWNRNLLPLTSRYIEEVNYFPSPCKEHSVTHDNHYFNSEWSSWLVFHSWVNHNNCSNQNAPPSPPPAWDSSPM